MDSWVIKNLLAILSLIITLILHAVAYGMMKQKVDIHERKHEKHEEAIGTLAENLSEHVASRALHTDLETLRQLRDELHRRLDRIEAKLDSINH